MPNPADEIADRLLDVQNRIANAAQRAGRSAAEIELVAVSKAQPPEAVHAALDAGQALFGENRVQEARAKIPLLPGRVRWHFVGHLQKNKIRHALPLFELFHGIDSFEIARDVSRIAVETGALPQVLLEVNVAGESTKFGFTPERLRARIEEVIALERLTVKGLMCIPPPQVDAENFRKFFISLRELRDRLQDELRISLPQLSMGMSGDFEVAVEEGATIVRVGTAIFGHR
jgi:pyridoxal phosphate enzyme (YggS family)